MKTVPDWKGFDSEQHWYAVHTAGGDGWEATAPIDKAIQKDILQASDDAFTEEEAQSIVKTPLEDWIDGLDVYTPHLPIDGIEFTHVAHFDIEAWKWREV